jgi:hypothetical protein
VEGVDAKIAALVRTSPDQIMVNDVTVNPVSKSAPIGDPYNPNRRASCHNGRGA